MAIKTTDTYPTDAIKLDAMTKGATVLDIACRIMERGIRTCPVGRMGVVDAMTAFTTGAIDTVDADVEPGIAPRAAGLAMAGLTDRQISLGNGTMIRAIQKAAVQGMRHLDRGRRHDSGGRQNWRKNSREQQGCHAGQHHGTANRRRFR